MTDAIRTWMSEVKQTRETEGFMGTTGPWVAISRGEKLRSRSPITMIKGLERSIFSPVWDNSITMSSFIHFHSSCFQEETQAPPFFECLSWYFLTFHWHVLWCQPIHKCNSGYKDEHLPLISKLLQSGSCKSDSSYSSNGDLKFYEDLNESVTCNWRCCWGCPKHLDPLQGCQPSVNIRTVCKNLTQNDLSVKVRKKWENIHKAFEVKQIGKSLCLWFLLVSFWLKTLKYCTAGNIRERFILANLANWQNSPK